MQITENMKLRINNNTYQVTVVEYFAIAFSAALLSEKPQHALPDLWCEGLMEVVGACHETYHALSSPAARAEALGDVSGVGDEVLLVPETKVLQAGNNVG